MPPCIEALPNNPTTSSKTKNSAAAPMLIRSTWCQERAGRPVATAVAFSAGLNRGGRGEGAL